jgi:hypothetical protein
VQNREEFRPKPAVFKDVPEERIASIFRIEEQAEQETIRSAHCREDLRSIILF